MGLLSSAEDRTVTAAMLSRAAELFGFAPGTVRVTLTRLKQRGTVQAVGRGLYALGPRSQVVQRDIEQWRTRSASVVGWPGDWVAMSTTALRADRSEHRRRSRALLRAGFAPAHAGLEIRPNNRRQPLPETRAWLADIAPGAPVFLAADLPAGCVERALETWNPRALVDGYRELVDEMNAAERLFDGLAVEDAAALAFDVGDRAIRAIVADPLLPDAFIDVAARTRFFDAMCRFDERGKEIWNRIMSEVTI